MGSDLSFFVRHINTNLNKGKEQTVQEGNRYKRLFANELVFLMKELISLPASRWLTAYVDHHSRSLNKHVPEELNHDGLRSTAAQLFKQSMLVPFSAPENDIWEYWPCCYGSPTEQQLNKMETLQKSQGTGQTNSRHWHQSHRRLTSDSHLLHHFNRNRLSRNDLLPRWLQNTYCQPLETNMLGFFLHSKQQPPDVAEDQTIICHYRSSGVFQNQEYFSHFAYIFWAKTQKLIYHVAVCD